MSLNFNKNQIRYKQPYDYQSYNNYPQEIKKYRKVNFKKKKAKKKNALLGLIALGLVGLYARYVCPYNVEHYLRPLYVNRILNRNIHLDATKYVAPTSEYLHNSYILDRYVLADKTQNPKEIADISMVGELTATKEKVLDYLMHHPNFSASVYVWEYSSGLGFEINSDKVMPSASIIKIPIAFELMRLIDKSSKTKNKITLDDEREFSEIYRTSGSGDLQRTKAGISYSLDYLAGIMISNSDNSATNIILNEIGGMDGFNRAMRNLGLEVTSMHQWLPDLEGTNKITAKEISKIIYNIDNPKYINPKYKSKLKEYLGNTKNTHLIKEKLPKDTMVLHKAGDIDTMLGDCGIVYTNNGRKYIVTILVQRPHNNPTAKTIIQNISLMIYNDIQKM